MDMMMVVMMMRRRRWRRMDGWMVAAAVHFDEKIIWCFFRVKKSVKLLTTITSHQPFSWLKTNDICCNSSCFIGWWLNVVIKVMPYFLHRCGSTLSVQVMAWCLTAPSHYLNQCWLIIWCVPWHSHESNFTSVLELNLKHVFRNYTFKIATAQNGTLRAPWSFKRILMDGSHQILPALSCKFSVKLHWDGWQ